MLLEVNERNLQAEEDRQITREQELCNKTHLEAMSNIKANIVLPLVQTSIGRLDGEIVRESVTDKTKRSSIRSMIAEASTELRQANDIEEGDYTYNGILNNKHSKRIKDSGISWDVALLRGYRSIDKKAAAKRLGFSERQANVPAIALPIYSVATGQIVNYQIRPDTPPIDPKTGKMRKYETPLHSRVCIDVHPGIFLSRALRDISILLFITEGIFKADAAISKGLCCLALLGVWNWRGTNEYGGKTVLPDWEFISLQDRKVYVVSDSDIMEKESVYDALVRIAAFLKVRGANVFPIYLPPGEGGSKTGLDDFFVARPNKTGEFAVQDLLEYATTELRERPKGNGKAIEIPYKETASGFLLYKESISGLIPTRLTNFIAHIINELEVDDGSEVKRLLTIEAEIDNLIRTFDVSSAQFTSMRWILENMGVGAVVYPGKEDHARCAIQLLSRERNYKKIFTHTGWRLIDDKWVYLHAGGALGDIGNDPNITVNLPDNISRIAFPEIPTSEQLRESIRNSLEMSNVGPPHVLYPLQALIYRAPLGPSDFTFWLSGDSGAGKSVLAALAQAHFGLSFTSRNAPANWSSTANALEAVAHSAKDIFVGRR
jgi:hypothetical protein